MSKRSGFYPGSDVDAAGRSTVSQAGAVVLLETVRTLGLDRGLSQALAPWRKPLAVHDPSKVVCDLAVMLTLGGDCLADVALLREQCRQVRPGRLRPDGVPADRHLGS